MMFLDALVVKFCVDAVAEPGGRSDDAGADLTTLLTSLPATTSAVTSWSRDDSRSLLV